MKDLGVIQKVARLPIVSYKVNSLFSPPLLDIQGRGGYTSILYIMLNDIKITNFSTLSDRRVVLEIPEEVTEIIDLSILASDSKESEGYSITLGMNMKAVLVEGIDKVIQKTIKVLMSSPGSDIFNPTLGGGLESFVAENYSSHGELSSEIVTAIKLAEEAILLSETRKDLPAASKLASITVLGVTPLAQSGVSISLEIMNQEGDTGKTSLSV